MTYERPYEELQKQYKTYRERFYMYWIEKDHKNLLREELAEYLCGETETIYGGKVTHVNLYLIDTTAGYPHL